jgi:type II secretory pathway pseudopilin PulG
MRKAFTIIEFIVLAVILGVLAATILPQFSTSARDAKMSNLKFNLRTVRSRLEAYKEDHAGAYPPATDSRSFVAQMTQKSPPNAVGGACGPYIEGNLPINPFNNSSNIAIVHGDVEPTAPTGSGDGWQYNVDHGWFYPNDREFFTTTGGLNDPN